MQTKRAAALEYDPQHMTQPRSWTIGSAPECDIVVDQPTVSGRHCQLTITSTGFELEDLGSTNGTFVNGAPVDGKLLVRRSDKITLGETVPFPWPEIIEKIGHQGSDRPKTPGRKPVKGRTVMEQVPEESHSPSAGNAPVPSAQRGAKHRKKKTGSPKGTETVRIGRELDNDVVINSPMVSRWHARMIIAGDRIMLEDLNSANGTSVTSEDNIIERQEVSKEDSIYFGSYRTTVGRLLADRGGPRRSMTISVQKEILLGRDADCDRVLDFPMISGRHARLVRRSGGFVLEDLGSSNGTFVNGHRLTRSAQVNPGDTISLGSFTLTLTEDGQLEQRDFRDSFTVEARGVCIDVPSRRLIEEVSLTILPGEFVGLMGPSGAGKSTLMNALNGYTPPSYGNVFINGHDLYREFDLFRGQIGFVPQYDIVHRELTVEEALFYSSRLRLPTDFTNADIRERIGDVLQQLGLEPFRKLRIGTDTNSVLSGGQRKRVNMAMELITDPSILFLDEPTSGLSSKDTVDVMKLLRTLADSGKTILLTIHQPSLDVFRTMDHLIIVAKDAGSAEPGQLAYFGPAYPDSIQFFNPELAAGADGQTELAPDDVLNGLAQRPAETWVKRFGASPYNRDFVEGRKDPRAEHAGGDNFQRQRKDSNLLQWITLSKRCLRIKLKDVTNSAILLAQAPVIAILIVFVFGKRAGQEMTPENLDTVAGAATTSVFLLALAALWFGCSNSVREIVAEWGVYRRERMVNLKILPFVASKLTVLGGLSFVQCLILMFFVIVGNDLECARLPMLIILLAASGVGLAIGLLVSALVKTSEVAVAVLPLILLPMVILGGVLHPIDEMNGPMKLCAQFMPSRWAFEGMLLLEADAREDIMRDSDAF